MTMTSFDWLLLSVSLYLVGAIASLLLARAERAAILVTSATGVLGGLAGLVAAVPVLLAGVGSKLSFDGPFPFASFALRLDPLAAFMVAAISLLATLCALYAAAYTREYVGRGVGAMGFFLNTFVASMLGLVVADNAFYFLIFFEMMSLASYFLVVFDQDREAVSAGFLYFLIAHAGSVLILIAFFILYAHTGSLDFAAFRQARLSPALASSVFLLAFFGFGAKAGMVPLHGWLPRAHPAAPSHASALMSGVMVKIGVFGIIKVGIDLLGATSAWWGLLVLAFGAVSAVLGVLYALAERDIKRLLAYSSVENVGIILMGVGVGLIGQASGHPLIAALGLLAALYHLLNHAVFKGLLFLGAGAVLYRVHDKDMTRMGGLARRMPLTATAFLLGALAICALPPLNGFVSEWFTYQALFSLGRDGSLLLRLAGPLAMVMLAITGALAVACLVNVYGAAFSGAPRSHHAAEASEVPLAMTSALLLLAAVCVALGLAAPWVAPVVAKVAASLIHASPLTVAQGVVVSPGNPAQAILSTPLITLLLLAIPLLLLLVANSLRGQRLAHRRAGEAWACGYAPDAHMPVSAGGFSRPLRSMFEPLFRLREALDPAPAMNAAMERVVTAATRTEPTWEDHVVAPVVRGVQTIGRCVQWLQHGDFRIYCLYVVAALVILLLVTVRLGGAA